MMTDLGGTDPARYTRLPTAPTPVRRESGPQLDGPAFDGGRFDGAGLDGAGLDGREADLEGAAVAHEEWHPDDGTGIVPLPAAEPRLAPWALLSAVVALFSSLFVGWGIPVAIVSVIAAIMSLRRPGESRTASVWALVLGLVATLYSLGWLLWAAYRAGWFG